MIDIPRVVCWYSCGAASAAATHLAIEEFGLDRVEIVYTATSSEHPDNDRFLRECEEWYGKKITILKSEKYADIWEVFAKTKYLVGVAGARCTTELKKKMRHDYQRVDDIQVFGFDQTEFRRASRFKNNNPEVRLHTPLIDKGMGKAECQRVLINAGIEIPEMYRLGYRNNNCIGCVKGQAGYWNKIRVDFPEVFARMAVVERELNVAINKSYAGDGKRKRVFLDELDPSAGRYKSEPAIECGVLCQEEGEGLD